MQLEEILLLLLPVAVVIGVPLYIVFRERMVRRKSENYSRKRVVKLTVVNFFLNTIAAFYFLTIFSLIVSRSFVFGFNNLFLTSLFVSMICLTFYGNGIYITSIVLEAFTVPQLRFNKLFKTQFIATHLFHGPISHVFIYSGWILVMFCIALVDLNNLPIAPSPNSSLLVGAGAIMGIFYAFAQIYNGTVPYQFITAVFTLIIFFIVVGSSQINVLGLPMGSYFFGFLTTFLATLTGYFIYQTTQGKNVDWDRSGY